MSKAFTKEDDGAAEELPDEPFLWPAGTKNYMTPAGVEKFRRELSELKHVGRSPENERRKRFLSRRLEHVEAVTPGTGTPKTVTFGTWVSLKNLAGEVRDYQIVGIDEADPAANRISWISPLAKRLLNKSVGDLVADDLEIVDIRYIF